MRPRDIAELLLLGAIWGASFLFMRTGAGEFGPPALVFLRVAGAALLLLPLVAWRGEGAALREHWRAIAVLGLVNSALPFFGFIAAALVLNAGLSSIFNATAPLWSATIGWLWLGQRPTGTRAAGLAIGFAGVFALGVHSASLKAGEHGLSPAAGVGLCLLATFFYGFAVHYTRRRLAGVPPMALAAGSQLSAAAFTLVPALVWWPAVLPGAAAWAGVAALAFVCTGLAYLLYFRLIAHTGAQNAIAVTYLVPLFGVLWGTLFLGEALSPAIVGGCAVILLGTALATGVIGARR
jgi:drug/metabolite transporter (DMT)-like permease